MPGLDGIAATRAIVDADPGVGVVVLTMSEDDETRLRRHARGARGYLLKGATRAEIVRAVTGRGRGRGDLRPGDRPAGRGVPRARAPTAVDVSPS